MGLLKMVPCSVAIIGYSRQPLAVDVVDHCFDDRFPVLAGLEYRANLVAELAFDD